MYSEKEIWYGFKDGFKESIRKLMFFTLCALVVFKWGFEQKYIFFALVVFYTYYDANIFARYFDG